MQIKTIAAIALLLAAAACRNEQPAPQARSAARPDTPASVTTDVSGQRVDTKIELIPDVLQKAEVGTQRDADGAVIADQSVVPANKPLHLTMWLRQSPPELQVASRWLDEKGVEVAVERRAANGEQIVTLSVEKGLPPGKYKVEGYWGGNLVFEKDVRVE